MRVTYHQDPGHGWLEVPIDTLRELGILSGMTEFSFRRGDTAYLEEDCDAGVFMVKAKEAGIHVDIVEAVTNHDHWIRNLARFPRPAVAAWTEVLA